MVLKFGKNMTEKNKCFCKEERETPEERKKRKQLEFKKQYNDYMKRVVNQILYEEIIE